MPCTSPKKWKNTKRKYWNISKKKQKRGLTPVSPHAILFITRGEKPRQSAQPKGQIFFYRSRKTWKDALLKIQVVYAIVYTPYSCV